MPCVDVEMTGVNIRNMRKKNGMTIQDVADACGVTAQAVSKWGRCMPTIDTIVVLMHVWGCEWDDIVAVKQRTA